MNFQQSRTAWDRLLRSFTSKNCVVPNCNNKGWFGPEGLKRCGKHYTGPSDCFDCDEGRCTMNCGPKINV